MHEKLSELKLFELKLLARELNIPVAAVREHGDLRLRSTWLSAIASAIADIKAETADTETATTSPQNVSSSEHMPKMGTSSEFDTKCDEVGLVDGQLAIHLGLPKAKEIAALVEARRWAEAFKVIHGNPTATRILQRIHELQQLRGEVAA